MTDGSARPAKQPMSIQQQAEFIDYLAKRCVLLDGSVASETFTLITRDEAAELRALAARLHRMAPHEDRIRRVVVGR